jgi:hypothetical protein
MTEKIDPIAELNKQLAEVTDIGIACASLAKTTQKAEREYMVAVYLWWRDANKHAGYLETLYRDNKYQYYKPAKGVNFTPLIRLTTGDALGKDYDSIWNRALNALHEIYEKRPKSFQQNTIDKLCNLFDSQNGKTGLAEKWKISKKDEKHSDDFNQWLELELNSDEFFGTIATEARNHYRKLQTESDFKFPDFQYNREGYSTLLVRRGKGGPVIVGSLADESLIDKALVATYRSDFDAIPIFLRSLIETIHILNIPNSASKDHNKFIDGTKFDDPLNPGKKLKQRRRIIYSKKESCFLNGQIHSHASPVVKAYPKISVFNQPPPDIHLAGDTQNWIETVLLRSRLFNIYKPYGNELFSLANHHSNLFYAINLQNKFVLDDEDEKKLRRYVKNLRHETICWQPFFETKTKHSSQISFDFLQHFPSDKNFTNFDWHAELNIHSLRNISMEFFEQWISTYAEKHKRPMNSTFKLELDNKICIHYEKSETIQAHDIKYEYDISNLKFEGNINLYVRSIDLSFILRQIADLNLISPLYLFAQEIGIILLFETEANCFSCFVPSCDLNGKRSEKGFNYFHPTVVETDQYYFPLDENLAPDESDYSDIDDPKALNSDLVKIENTFKALREEM